MNAAPDTRPRRVPATAAKALQQIPRLLEAARWGQTQRLSEIAEEIASLVEGGSPALARKLRSAQPLSPTKLVAAPTDLVDVLQGSVEFNDVVLPDDVRTSCEALIEEQRHREELAAWSVHPAHKVLLSGPPGNGKTMLANALATSLGIPFIIVRYGGLMASYLGTTGKNIDKVFEYAQNGPCLLFLDEFDGIAVDRSQAGDVGELRRITNQLLLTIDRMPAHVVLVCATNQEQLVDPAVRRRFDTHLTLPAPTHDMRLRLATSQLAPELCNGVDLRQHAQSVAADIAGYDNLDAVAKACQALRRRHALQEIARRRESAGATTTGA